jgi:carboxyl-terminal processing protease
MHPQQKHANPTISIGVSMIVIAVFAGGFLLGSTGVARSLLPAAVAQSLGVAGPPDGVDLTPVWKAWAIMDERFVAGTMNASSTATSSEPEIAGTPEEKRVYGMIAGMAQSLGDPYTFFLPPVEQKQFEEDLAGNFEGVGMEIAIKDEVLTVVAPLKGTPAERAGLKPNDKVLKIDEHDTRGMDVTSAVNRIRGPKGSEVRLLIGREGWTAPQEIKVMRDVINIPVLESEHRSDGIFVISLHNFTANSPMLFRQALREFVDSGSNKLVLDLRGNPGGYLEASVDMASWFLPSGKVVVTEDYGGNQRNVDHRSRGYDVFNENLKMVILVDKGSASASEILAGALAHYDIAQTVGTNTFGKGSVQELIPITENTGLKITVARWLLPDGHQIPKDGIVPDVEVKLTEEDVKAERDLQMEKAVEILRSR